MAWGFDRPVEFLNRRHNQATIPSHLCYQLSGVVGGVHTLRTKIIKFLTGLVVKVSAIDHKQHFMDFGQFFEDLGSFEAGEGFP
ncbi:hypothetical protein DSM107007_39140 [Nostoc sp. PCC 7120 = FACHB-418]|nr:hypothetical protein DSM107007_39140 [Nostoc sp. PCC 7120 = FACHB-418]